MPESPRESMRRKATAMPEMRAGGLHRGDNQIRLRKYVDFLGIAPRGQAPQPGEDGSGPGHHAHDLCSVCERSRQVLLADTTSPKADIRYVATGQANLGVSESADRGEAGGAGGASIAPDIHQALPQGVAH